MKLSSIDPNTHQLIGEVTVTEIKNIPSLIEKSKEAQLHWKEIPIETRLRIFKKVKEILYESREEIAHIITKENGKPLFESYATEIIPALSILDYYIKNSKEFLKPHFERIKIPVMIQKKSWIEYEPYGVIGIISPWNYPLLLPIGQIVPALIAGNSVIFKPSEWTPLTGEKIDKLFKSAGLPENVFITIYGGSDNGEALVKSNIDKLFFTGSTRVGKIIAKTAAERLLPISLELGGKDAAIILDDADLDRAAMGITWGAIMNTGQTCVSIERVYVQEKIFDSFLKRIIEFVSQLKVFDNSLYYDYSKIKLQTQVDTIREHIEDALAKGAKIIYGGKIEHNFVQPTILIDVNHSMKVMREETFGPVIPIMKFKTIEKAISLANDCNYGLSASIWSKNISLSKSIAKKIQAGSVLVNDCISYFGAGEAVVGGIKMSGNGRVHGRSGIMEMVYEKYYNQDPFTWQKKLWWFNYTEKSTQLIKEATQFLFDKNLFRKLFLGMKVLPELFRKR